MNKKSIIVTVFWVSLILLSVSGVLSQTQNESIGSFTALSGSIKYDKGGENGYIELTKEDALKLSFYSKDKILTSDATTGEIMTSCGAALSVKANTELQMDYYNTRINKGGVWINYKPVKNNKGEYKFKVETPVGTIGIRGTKFAVLVSQEDKKVMVQVTEGVVSFDSPKGSTEINSGELLTVENEKNIEKPVKVSPDTDILKADEKNGKDGKKKKVVEKAPEMQENNSSTNPWNNLENK